MFGDSEVSTTFAAANTGVAQLVEHWSPKPGVGSSSLSSRAERKRREMNFVSLLFLFLSLCQLLLHFAYPANLTDINQFMRL